MKSALTYLGLLALCCLYMVANPYPIEGVSAIQSNLVMVGIWNGMFVTAIAMIVGIRGSYKYTDIFIGAIFSTIFLFSPFMITVVEWIELLFKGRLPETYEQFYGSKRNVYMAFMMAVLAMGVFYVRFAPTTARKLSLAPLMIIFMSLNFYHYYQFFLFSNNAIIEVRDSSLTYIANTIQRDNFMESCEGIERLKCYEWYEGDKFPEESLIPASKILHEIKLKYEGKPWEKESHVRPAEQGIQSHKDGQIDDSFAPAFWATINYDVNTELGRHRLAVHDDTGLVYRATVQGGIALAIASFLWMTLCLILMQYHPNRKPKTQPKKLWLIPVLSFVLFWLLNPEPIHMAYPILLPLVLLVYVFPIKLADKAKMKKVGLGAAIVLSHVVYSYVMFAEVDPNIFTGLLMINLLILSALWIKQTYNQESPHCLSLGYWLVVLTLVPVFYFVKFHTDWYDNVDFGLTAVLVSSLYWLYCVFKMSGEIVSRTLKPETAVAFGCMTVLLALTCFIIFFVTPYSIEYIQSLQAQPIVGGRNLFDMSEYQHKIIQFHGIVVVTLGIFLKLIHYYLSKGHSKHKLKPA